MGHKLGHKNSKGVISINDYKGRIRLRWRYQGVRYSLNLSRWDQLHLLQAKKLALQIEQDMILEQFDVTLDKYRDKPKAPVIKESRSMVNYFETWVKVYKQMDCEINIDYYNIRNTIRKWGDFNQKDMLKWLNKEKFAPSTYNSRLTILNSFADWLVKMKIWEENPLESVNKKRVPNTVKENSTPFTKDEITAILNAVNNDTFCPTGSRYKHSFYYPFIYFIFKTGVRNAEAVGLRVSSIDLIRKHILIKEVLARSTKGTHAEARVRKETKNGKERLLPLTDDLLEVLKPVLINKQPDDLVFQSFKGLPIDDRMFQRRVFKVVLKGLNIKDRALYACRHTFGSRCIDAGINPVMTAFLMGNNPETALKNYTHMISLPKDLPSI
jgi:integrase